MCLCRLLDRCQVKTIANGRLTTPLTADPIISTPTPMSLNGTHPPNSCNDMAVCRECIVTLLVAAFGQGKARQVCLVGLVSSVVLNCFQTWLYACINGRLTSLVLSKQLSQHAFLELCTCSIVHGTGPRLPAWMCKVFLARRPSVYNLLD